MTNQDDLTRLFSCSEVDAQVLKEVLNDNQIPSLIRNDMNSGKAAGFGGGYAGSEAHVYVFEKDLEKAKGILEQFQNSLENE